MTGPPHNRVHREARRKVRTPTLVVQERDLKVLRAIFESRFLTRDLLLELFPPDAARTPTKAVEAARAKRFLESAGRTPHPLPGTNLDRRLVRFFQNGFLDRFRATPAGEFAYALTWKGVELLQNEDVDFPIPPLPATGERERRKRAWDENNRQAGASFLDHTLAVARFRIALTKAVSQTSGVVLERFEREHPELSAAWSVSSHSLPEICRRSHKRPSEITIYPDGFFILREPGGPASAFFLEIDRGTAQLGRVLEKFIHYERLYTDRQHQRHFGIESFHVLTVAPRPGRASNLLNVVADGESPVHQRHRSLFLFTAEDAYLKHPANVLAAIWRSPDNPEERCSLIGSPLPRRGATSE
jgi:hypothetical protein